MFSWQFSTNGATPPGAVEAGVTAEGEKLYFGRVTHDGCTTPGKVKAAENTHASNSRKFMLTVHELYFAYFIWGINSMLFKIKRKPKEAVI